MLDTDRCISVVRDYTIYASHFTVQFPDLEVRVAISVPLRINSFDTLHLPEKKRELLDSLLSQYVGVLGRISLHLSI